MKPNYFVATTLICATALWLGMATDSPAGGTHGHEGEHDAAHGGHDAAANREDLQTAAEVWSAIETDVERLSQTIDAGKLADVHKIAFGIRDLTNELPAKSTDLSEAKQKMLAGYVERVVEHAKNLDNYGDGGDAERTAAEFAELEKRLGYMRKLYQEPASALSR